MTLEKRFKKILSSDKITKIPYTPLGDECALYTGANVNGIPVVQIDGKLKSIVRAMFEFFNNRTIVPKTRLSNRCGKKACLNPRHWIISYEKRYGDEYGVFLKNYVNGRDYKG